jgi:hypothetical protein
VGRRSDALRLGDRAIQGPLAWPGLVAGLPIPKTARLPARSTWQDGAANEHWGMGFNMNRLLIVAILIIGILPLYAQSQQPDAAELAQKVVGIVGGNKTKTQTYCQVLDLSDELDQVDRQKDREKAEDLSRKINELQKTLGPEYLALLEAAKYVDPNSKDGQEIVSIFDKLDENCPH